MVLIALSRILNADVLASDSQVGRLRDVYFDPLCWQARYLGVGAPRATGGPGLLVSVFCVAEASSARVRLHASAGQLAVGGGAWPADTAARWLVPARMQGSRELLGAPLGARDGDAGRVCDLLLDAEHWSIEYLVAGQVPGTAHMRLVPTHWVERLDPAGPAVRFGYTRAQLAQAPHA